MNVRSAVTSSPILAVLGPAAASKEEMALAEGVGAIAARAGWVVLTGGGSGVMAAAARGAVEAGGLTIGVLPNSDPAAGYPNPWIILPIYTGMANARNAINVLSATLCVALGGGPGTLSEIGLALKTGREVWCWKSWSLEAPPGTATAMPRVFDTADELLMELREALSD